MTTRQMVIGLVQKLPDEASMKEIAREIEFVAGINEAMEEFDRGGVVSAEQAYREIGEWAKNTR